MDSLNRKRVRPSAKKDEDEAEPASPKQLATQIEAWHAWIAKGPHGPIDDPT